MEIMICCVCGILLYACLQSLSAASLHHHILFISACLSKLLIEQNDKQYSMMVSINIEQYTTYIPLYTYNIPTHTSIYIYLSIYLSFFLSIYHISIYPFWHHSISLSLSLALSLHHLQTRSASALLKGEPWLGNYKIIYFCLGIARVLMGYLYYIVIIWDAGQYANQLVLTNHDRYYIVIG